MRDSKKRRAMREAIRKVASNSHLGRDAAIWALNTHGHGVINVASAALADANAIIAACETMLAIEQWSGIDMGDRTEMPEPRTIVITVTGGKVEVS